MGLLPTHEAKSVPLGLPSPPDSPSKGRDCLYLCVPHRPIPHALPTGALGGWYAGGWVSEQTKVGLRLAPCGMRFGGQDLGGGPECWLVGFKVCGTMGTFSAL